MSSSTPAEVNHIQSQELRRAFNELNAALNNRYAGRLALQQFILRHVFNQTGLQTLPVQDVDLTKIWPMAEDLADSFLRRHVGELGWTDVYHGPRDLTAPDQRDWHIISSTERELRRALEVFVAQLLQMPADKNQWSELYLDVLKEVAVRRSVGVGTTRDAATAARKTDFATRDLSPEMEVQSETETTRARGRVKPAVRRSKVLVRGLSEFVNESEEMKRRRKGGDAKHRPAEPVEASDDSTEGTPSETGSAKGSEESGDSRHGCSYCDEAFTDCFKLNDHMEEVHLRD